MSNNKILVALRSPNAVLVVLVLALVAQMPHAADVFRLIVHGNGLSVVAHSYSFAVALELAVLLFVVQNRHIASYCFAGVSIAMNLSYYALNGVHLIAVDALPALLVSVALPVAIALYSHAVAGVNEDTSAQPTRPRTVQPDDAQPEPVPSTIDKRQRAYQLHSEGLTNAQIALELGAHRNTVGAWLRAAKEAQP